MGRLILFSLTILSVALAGAQVPNFPLNTLPYPNFPMNGTPESPYRNMPGTYSGKFSGAQTSFPGVTCALIDNRPAASLVAAIQNLSQAIKPQSECQSSSDLAKVHEDVNGLMDAVKGLNQFWENPDAINQGNNLAQFQTLLERSIHGIDRVGRTLSSNNFLGGKCGREAMGIGDMFIAFTDLVTAFAPFALIGASMNPSLGVALPYVLGVTGVGSAAKIINNMLKEQGLDATRPEVRQAILRNICEYMKIADKVRFLKLAQSGQLEAVTMEIQGTGMNRLASLYNVQPPEVQDLIRERNQSQASLRPIGEDIPRDRAELTALKSQFREATDAPLACELARQVAAIADQTERFPGRSIVNYQTLVSYQSEATLVQQALIQAEANLRQRLIKAEEPMETCAQIGRSYVETLSRILSASEDLHRKTLDRITADLSRKNPEFGRYVAQEEKTRQDIRTGEKITHILELLNQDNAILDKVEISAQLSVLKNALFGKPSGLVNNTSRWLSFLGIESQDSPAMEYLKFISDQQDKMATAFRRELDALLNDVIYYKPLYDPFVRDEKGEIKRDKFGFAVRKSVLRASLDAVEEMRARGAMKVVTPELFASNPESQARFCQRLENIWLAWAAVMDHLGAQSFFCSQIRSLFDSETDPDLVEQCDGKVDIRGNQIRPSGLQIMQSKLATPEFKEKALLISEKIHELQCRMPEGAVLLKDL